MSDLYIHSASFPQILNLYSLINVYLTYVNLAIIDNMNQNRNFLMGLSNEIILILILKVVVSLQYPVEIFKQSN